MNTFNSSANNDLFGNTVHPVRKEMESKINRGSMVDTRGEREGQSRVLETWDTVVRHEGPRGRGGMGPGAPNGGSVIGGRPGSA